MSPTYEVTTAATEFRQGAQSGPIMVVGPHRSDFRRLGEFEGIFHFDTEVPYRVLNLCVAEQDLNRPEIARGFVNN
jgi:hypothetical protein